MTAQQTLLSMENDTLRNRGIVITERYAPDGTVKLSLLGVVGQFESARSRSSMSATISSSDQT